MNPSKRILQDLDDQLFVSFVPMDAISNEWYIEKFSKKPLWEVRQWSYTYFAENDVIIAKITPCMENGKSALAQGLENWIALGSSEFHVFRCSDALEPHYLFHYLNRSVIRQEAEKSMTGSSGHRRVPIGFYENLEIPLLPLSLQKWLVFQIKTIQNQIAIIKKENQILAQDKQQILEKYL